MTGPQSLLPGTLRIASADASFRRYLRIDTTTGESRIVMDAPPELSLFAFHLTWPGATEADEDRATRALMDETTRRGRVMITGSIARGRFLGRVCILSFRTHAAEIDALIEDLAAAIDVVRGR